MTHLVALFQVLVAVHSPGAVVTGTVRSTESDQPLPGAIVELSDLGRAAVTDKEGRYTFRDVPPGAQHIQVRFIGHAPRTLNALVPESGTLEISILLVRQPVLLPSLEIRSPIALRNLESRGAGYPDRELSIAAVRNDPLLAEPDVFKAMAGGEVVLDPESPGAVHIRGGTSDQTGYQLDGIPVLNPYHAQGIFSAWNPDALSQLQLTSGSSPATGIDALSGVISAATITPGSQFRTQGSFSNSQTRLTVDGPLSHGAGYLLSYRAGFANLFGPKSESSYTGGGTGDWLAKLEFPALGGAIRLLGYGNQNEIDAATAISDRVQPALNRNVFEWDSRSLGAEWRRDLGGIGLRVLAWNAATEAESHWLAQTGPLGLHSGRSDFGGQAQATITTDRATTTLGLRLERRETGFTVRQDTAGSTETDIASVSVIAGLSASQVRRIATSVELELGGRLSFAGRDGRLGPHARISWRPSGPLVVSAGVDRQHQFSQSLRNGESVVGSIFPADLWIGAGARRAPVARSDLGFVSLEYHPSAGVRIGAQLWQRHSSGLVLVAPTEGEPFAIDSFASGSASSRGVAFIAGLSSQRWGLSASYGLQDVTFRGNGVSYTPAHGAHHLLDLGVIVFPTRSTSIKLGASAAFGRRGTMLANGFEWESCNLKDRGCEFGGNPYFGGQTLGGTRLPNYYRVDLGVRKQWNLDLGGRQGMIALFTTATNLFNRTNILTYSRDSGGKPFPIEMRPFSLLVIGVDWGL
jgi:hypothetical protein